MQSSRRLSEADKTVWSIFEYHRYPHGYFEEIQILYPDDSSYTLQ